MQKAILFFICLCFCFHLPGCITRSQNAEILALSDQFEDIFMSIIEPTFPFLGESRIDRDNHIAVVEYFRDNDFSEKFAELENIFFTVNDLEFKDEFDRDTQMTAYSIMINKLGLIYYLMSLGQAYQGEEVGSLSPEDKACIFALRRHRDNNK